jgi:hypothetical protein
VEHCSQAKDTPKPFSPSGGGFGGDSEGEGGNIEKISSGFGTLDSSSNLGFASSLVVANQCLLGRDLLDQPFQPPPNAWRLTAPRRAARVSDFIRRVEVACRRIG